MIKQIAELKIRLDRGASLVGWAKNLIVIVAGIKIIFPSLDIATLVIATLFIFFSLGHLDIRFFKLLQAESNLLTAKYNPYFARRKR